MAAVPSVGRAADVEAPAAASAAATRSLYERFAGQLYGYCLHQLGSREEAEDAVQTTFLNVFRGLKRGIVPEVESAWLFKIAHNVCLSRRRSSRRRGRVEAPNNMEVLQEVVAARDRGSDDLIRLQDALEGMPETQRRAILLREWQGLSYREIAETLALSQSAVETLIFRARRTLAAGLGDAPPAAGQLRKRARYSIDVGGLAAAFKTLLGGGAAIKTAATIAAVATTAVAVSTETRHHAMRPPTAAEPKARAVAPSRPAAFTRAPVALGPVRNRTRARVVRHVVPAPAAAAPRIGGGAAHTPAPASRPEREATIRPSVAAPSTPPKPAQPTTAAPAASEPAEPSPAAASHADAPPAAKPESGGGGKALAKGHDAAPTAPPPQTQPAQPAEPAAPEDAAAQNGQPPKPDKPNNGNGNGNANGHG